MVSINEAKNTLGVDYQGLQKIYKEVFWKKLEVTRSTINENEVKSIQDFVKETSLKKVNNGTIKKPKVVKKSTKVIKSKDLWNDDSFFSWLWFSQNIEQKTNDDKQSVVEKNDNENKKKTKQQDEWWKTKDNDFLTYATSMARKRNV